MSDTTYKLPIWRTARDTYALIFANFGFLIRRGWPWMLLAMVLLVGFDWGMMQAGARSAESVFTLRDLIGSSAQSLLQAACLATFAVQWHRHVLHAADAHQWPTLRVILAYGAAAFLIETCFSLMFYLPVLPIATDRTAETNAMLVAAFIVSSVIGAYLWCRMSLILPAIAIGRNRSLRTAWSATTNNGWRLFFSSLVAFLLPLILVLVTLMAKWGAEVLFAAEPPETASKAPDPALPAAWSLLDSFENILLLIPFAIIAISFLSVAYRELVLKREGAASPAP